MPYHTTAAAAAADGVPHSTLSTCQVDANEHDT